MPWKPCDQHLLSPIPGWFGRYKCNVCGVVLYKRIVQADPFTPGRGKGGTWIKGDRYVAYKCTRCRGQTTGRQRKCPACREKERKRNEAEAANQDGREEA